MDKQILIRYIAGDASDTEKHQVMQWIDTSPENMREFLAVRKLYDLTLWNDPQTTKQTTTSRLPYRISIRRIATEALKIAAVFLLGVLFFSILQKQKPELAATQQTLYVPAGQRAELTLADGSHVWLNANTTLTFPTVFTSGTREVTVDGEGYFKVAKDPENPFVVHTGKYEVKVLGTEFNLLSYSADKYFELSLLEGSVEVLKPGAEKGAKIQPGQKLFLENDQFYVTQITHNNYYLWKDGIISFDDEPFAGMAKKLELYFDMTIHIENQKLLDYRCTGKFRSKDGVEHILKVLQLSNRFSYSIDDKRSTITIK
jgi:transmembrane sensor